MPYRNVYEEKDHPIARLQRGEEPEKDPKKIEAIYASQIPYTPGTSEFEERKRMLTAPNLVSTNGRQVSAARAKQTDRGIRKSILGKSQNRGR